MSLSDYYNDSAHSDYYGAPRPGGRTHRGDDFSHSTAPGTIPVPALLSGTVVNVLAPADWHGFGWQITIESNWNGRIVRISYAHGAWAPPFGVGAWVEQGQHVLVEGTTGGTDGSCVHIEWNEGGSFHNPYPNILAIVGGGGGGGGGGALQPNQRRATAGGTRGRAAATRNSAEVAFLDEGEVGDFSGFVIGEMIDGVNGWAVGAYSGAYFWMGGLSPLTTDGLPNLTPALPNQRTATAGGTRGRQAPSTKSGQIAFLDEGEIGDFNGWRNGEVVDGEGRWLRGAHSGAWFWLGGLAPQSTDGLEDLNDAPEPEPNPEPGDGRVIYPKPAAPTYPEATRWAHSSKSDPRKAGSEIALLIFHGWGKFPNDAEDEWNYFTGWQGDGEGSSPTWQVNADGSTYEAVPPDAFRPWTTGSVDHRAVTVEAQPISGPPTWSYSDAQYERFARLAVFAHQRWGIPLQVAELTGTGKETTIVKPGLTQHNLTPAGKESKTVCPGPSFSLQRIIDRALELLSPQPEPTNGIAPSREWWSSLRENVRAELALLDKLLGE